MGDMIVEIKTSSTSPTKLKKGVDTKGVELRHYSKAKYAALTNKLKDK